MKNLIVKMFYNLSERLTLGILYKDNKIVNHRSLLKVLVNPLLRSIGLCIGSEFENNKIKKMVLFKTQPTKLKYDFNSYNEYDKIIKKRIIL